MVCVEKKDHQHYTSCKTGTLGMDQDQENVQVTNLLSFLVVNRVELSNFGGKKFQFN